MKIPLHIELSRQKKAPTAWPSNASGQAIDAFVYLKSKLHKKKYLVNTSRGDVFRDFLVFMASARL
jgi:hypothetical protein